MLFISAASGALLLAAASEPAPEPVTTVDSIIVTARRDHVDPAVVADARQLLSRTPGAVAVVAAEAFEDRLATGFADTLRGVPGVLAQKRYGEESRLSIRGSGLGQGFHQRGVLLAQDGVPFADADGFSDFQGVDTLAARYIEVWKGGNALRFGGAQLGGAVNLVTPSGRTAAHDARFRFESGSFGTSRAHVALARVHGDWDAHATASGLMSDGYREQSAQSQGRAGLNLGRSFGEGREVRLILQAADLNQEAPGSLSLTDALTDPTKAPAANILNGHARDQTLKRATLQTRWRLDGGTVFEGAIWGWEKTLWHPIFQVVAQDSRTAGAFGRFDWRGAVAGRRADVFYGVSWRDGDLDARRYVNTLGQAGTLTADGLQRATALDAFAEGRLFVTDRLALVAGGSYGRATRDYQDRLRPANDAAADFDWVAPRIGLLWEDDDGAQVFANLTRSVEPPTYGALVQAALPGFTPVRPQAAWTGEAGTRGRRGPLAWDLAVYRSEIDGEMLNFIVGPDIPAATFNAGRTIHQGIEAGLDWRLPLAPAYGDLTLRQVWTFNDFRFDGDARWGDNRLPVAPEHQHRAELKFTHPAGWFIAPSVERRAGETFVDYANTLRAPGFTVWSLNAGIDIGRHVTLFIDGRNLTDERYAPEFSAVTDARTANTAVFFPGEGRAAFVGLRINH